MTNYGEILDKLTQQIETAYEEGVYLNKWYEKEIKELKDTKEELAKYKALEQELKLFKKAFEICYEAVDIDTPNGSKYECIFAYDAFPLTSNQEEVAIVKKAAELLNKEKEE